MLKAHLRRDCNTITPALRRRYLREFLPAMLGYVVMLFLSLTWLKHINVDRMWLRGIVALLPIPPIALVLRAIVRRIRDADELQRRIELESISLATATVSLLYMAAAFLQLAKVIDVAAVDALLWAFPLICLVYGLVKLIVSRRFR
jgi:hypothetical protein